MTHFHDKLPQAAVAAGSAFFGALVGVGLIVGGPVPGAVYAAAIAAGVAFFASLGGNGIARERVA